ncbi:DUF7311 family protein [Haloprofundus halobius]|uniref:DUF7311 family protein n=1 Tax=Haloprofundus halobius TaxID=2876194 RepID=UPI001CC9D081|nr:hypothetical protein [Haloprofundus halobius]
MIRLVVTVALAVVLTAASLPAVDAARDDRTATHLDGELVRVVDAARDLPETEDATSDESLAARRVVSVRIPERSLTNAHVDYVELDGSGGSTARPSLSYRLGGHEEASYRLAEPVFATPGGPLRLSASGTHRLRLSLLERGGRPVVAVGRLDPRTTSDGGGTG